MPKRIVVLADGTGNSRAALFRTNVWKLYDALDLTPGSDQVAYYHDGVVTSSFAPLKFLGSVFGFGLAGNVRDMYAFLCRNYQPGDDIYIFGFSRGAFTARILASFISHTGVRPGTDEAACPIPGACVIASAGGGSWLTRAGEIIADPCG